MSRSWKRTAGLLALPLLLSLMVGVDFARNGLQRFAKDPVWRVPGGDAGRGAAAIQTYGCAGCHTIPGIRTARGRVGPRLDRLFEQTYLAGVLPNTPEALVQWIQDPQEVDPQTAMPDLNVTEQDARDIAAYLYLNR